MQVNSFAAATMICCWKSAINQLRYAQAQTRSLIYPGPVASLALYFLGRSRYYDRTVSLDIFVGESKIYAPAAGCPTILKSAITKIREPCDNKRRLSFVFLSFCFLQSHQIGAKAAGCCCCCGETTLGSSSAVAFLPTLMVGQRRLDTQSRVGRSRGRKRFSWIEFAAEYTMRTWECFLNGRVLLLSPYVCVCLTWADRSESECQVVCRFFPRVASLLS